MSKSIFNREYVIQEFGECSGWFDRESHSFQGTRDESLLELRKKNSRTPRQFRAVDRVTTDTITEL